VAYSQYVIFQMAEVAVPCDLFARIPERSQWFGVPPPLVRRACCSLDPGINVRLALLSGLCTFCAHRQGRFALAAGGWYHPGVSGGGL